MKTIEEFQAKVNRINNSDLTVNKQAAERNQIGFKTNTDVAKGSNSNALKSIEEMPFSELEKLILQVGCHYLERRANSGYLDGANKDLTEMMNKVYVRYFEKIA